MSEKGNEVNTDNIYSDLSSFSFSSSYYIIIILYHHTRGKQAYHVHHQKNVKYILCNLKIRAALSRMVSN